MLVVSTVPALKAHICHWSIINIPSNYSVETELIDFSMTQCKCISWCHGSSHMIRRWRDLITDTVYRTRSSGLIWYSWWLLFSLLRRKRWRRWKRRWTAFIDTDHLSACGVFNFKTNAPLISCSLTSFLEDLADHVAFFGGVGGSLNLRMVPRQSICLITNNSLRQI